jgi:tetratricopeptide (TPR) repeat protein
VWVRGSVIAFALLVSGSLAFAQDGRLGSQRTEELRQHIQALDRSLTEEKSSLPQAASLDQWTSVLRQTRLIAGPLILYGDAEGGRRRYEEALAVSRELAEIDVDAARLETSRSLTGLGQLLIELGERDPARRRFEEALLAIRDDAGSNADAASLASIITQELGELDEAQGELEAAKLRFEESLALYQLRTDRDDVHVANLQERVGRMAFLSGDLVRASEIFSATNMIWRQEADAGRLRTLFSGGLVRNLLMLGDIAAAQGDRPKARQNFEEALSIAQARAEMRFRGGTLGSDQPQINRDLMVASARMYQVTGTRAFAREARSIARRLRGNGLLSEEDAALIATLE